MKHHTSSIYIVSLISLALLSACGKEDTKTSPSPKPTEIKVNESKTSANNNAPTTNKNEPTKETKNNDSGIDQLGQKLNAYIDCYNSLDGNAHKSIDRYALWVKDMAKGPTGKENVVYGLYQLRTDTITKCKAQFETIAKQAPTLAKLDEAAVAYINVLTAMNPKIEEAHLYYDRENYKDDKFAKAKTLHPELVNHFEKFKNASKVFSDVLDIENDKLLAAELVDIEKTEGRKFNYHRMVAMNKAKIILNIITKNDFNLETANAQYSAFEKAVDELNAYAKANEKDRPMMWSSFESKFEELRKAAKARIRRVRDKVAYDEGEIMTINAGSGWMIEGSPDKLIRVYDELINQNNSLR